MAGWIRARSLVNGRGIVAVFAVGALGLVIAVQVGIPRGARAGAPPETGPDQVVVGPAEGEGPVGTAPDDATIHAARADLAARLGVDVESIAVVSADAVTWPDGALGCPQPGRAYPQIVMPGYRVVFSVDDVTYEYHGQLGGDPFFCKDPRPPIGGQQ
ncbi:MAG TPA: hypothetical protein VFC51_13865 [Chloroflexota bacterium]|nr:hypothetical protein [Chloroflexota bacterium]